MDHCPVCLGQVSPDQETCLNCGLSLAAIGEADKLSTVQIERSECTLNQPRWGDPYLAGERSLCLLDANSLRAVEVSFADRRAVILGRVSSTSSPETPLIDLSDLNARLLGVSRAHAQLDTQRNIVYITDLGSTNCTYLNGHRLAAYQPRILRDGDELELGDLRLLVAFQPTPEAVPTC